MTDPASPEQIDATASENVVQTRLLTGSASPCDDQPAGGGEGSHRLKGSTAAPTGEHSEMVGTTTLGSMVERYVSQRVRSGQLTVDSARGARTTLHRLAAIHGRRPADTLGRPSLLAWADTLGNLHAGTRRGKVSHVRGFLTWLTAEGVLRKNPVADLPKVKVPRGAPRALDGDLFLKLWLTLPDVRAQAIVMLMFGLGLRCVEVSRLHVEDWSRRDQLIRVTGKGGHERVVPVPPQVADALNDYLSQYPSSTGPMIRSYTRAHQPLKPQTISERVVEWMAEAGIKHAPRDGVGAHALRHTAASDLLDACGDLRIVQEYLGHAHLATTSVYLRRAGTAKMREALAARWATTEGETG